MGQLNESEKLRDDSFNHHGILGISNNRKLTDGGKVSQLKTYRQQVDRIGLRFSCILIMGLAKTFREKESSDL
ncbi:hypothetical protein [Okeania sp. SIO2B3]|uniref:hypothetical protein n=1 Tax=Okeania sp. SIO2B3 TaxID=2607784 RepID=UPI0013C22AF4|nr:hypothetical protein [Okeania sp. SIO2B3]NET45189.1 hypothetical protein [Okeania sp. SIO2B3]